MGDTNFLQSSVTISKGGKVTLIDDASVVHIIQNGSWDNGAAKPAKEAGAPTVQVNFQGNDTHDIGPFNTAGTFHVYCTVHPGMNLTITVQ
jgi:plastocyanin